MNNSSQKNIPYIIGVIVFALLIIFVVKQFLINPSSSNSSQQSVLGATATKQLNRVYSFPINDDKGKQISTLRYELQGAEIRNQILIKGQTATAISGKEFLVINLKITNPSDNNISMQTHDYVRLSTGDKKEWLSPDIHNDPVDVAAISTKYTRLGFTINTSNQNNLILQVGEIKGSKDNIIIKF